MTIARRDYDMDRVWNNFFYGQNKEGFSPVYDITETENEYSITIELPGVLEDEVNIELKDRQLRVEITEEKLDETEDKSDTNVKETKYLVRNRVSKNTNKVFLLPEDANIEDVKAVMKNGILTLNVNKKEEKQPKKITIN